MKGLVWRFIERFAGIVTSQQFQDRAAPGFQFRRMRRYLHAFREAGFAGCYWPLMSIDFNQTQPTVAGGHQRES